jgi:very-short-patch-repair endonuclease
MDQSLGMAMEVIPVPNAVDDPQARINKKEAETVIKHLRDLIDDTRYEGLDFGVCSPFRNQADYIQELINKEFSPKEIQDRRLISTTADGFQGDEREVILYSFRYAANSSPNIFTLAGGTEGQQRMNVAFTRARRRAVCFVSHSIANFPPGLVRDFLRHAAHPGAFALEGEPWDSKFERDVHAFLESKGLEVRPQVKACGYRLDFVVRNGNGRIAALEADGWEVHYPDGHLREEDTLRQRVLERAGWTVFRVHSRAFYRDPENALAEILDFFGIGDENGEAVECEAEPYKEPRPQTELIEKHRKIDRVRIDPNKIPLQKYQEALRVAAPEPGIEIRRAELFRRALPHVDLRRLSKRTCNRFQSAMKGLIRKGEFGNRGREVVWKLKLEGGPQSTVPSMGEAQLGHFKDLARQDNQIVASADQFNEDYELLKLLIEENGVIEKHEAAEFLKCSHAAAQVMLECLAKEGFALVEGTAEKPMYKWREIANGDLPSA